MITYACSKLGSYDVYDLYLIPLGFVLLIISMCKRARAYSVIQHLTVF